MTLKTSYARIGGVGTWFNQIGYSPPGADLGNQTAQHLGRASPRCSQIENPVTNRTTHRWRAKKSVVCMSGFFYFKHIEANLAHKRGTRGVSSLWAFFHFPQAAMWLHEKASRNSGSSVPRRGNWGVICCGARCTEADCWGFAEDPGELAISENRSPISYGKRDTVLPVGWA